MLNRFTYFFIGFILLISILAFAGYSNFISIGNVLIMPILAFYYFYNRRKNVVYSDKIMGLLFGIAALSDAQFFLGFSNIWIAIQVFLTSIVIVLYILIFRREGTYLRVLKITDLLKFIWISLTVYVFYIMIMGRELTETIITGGIYYAIFESALIVSAFLRKVNRLSFMLGLWGVALKFSADIFYGFISTSEPTSGYFIVNFVLYAISQCLLIMSFLVNQGNLKK